MTIPGVGQLTALAFVAAIDDPSRIHRSRDIGAYLGLVPRRYQSGEVDYTGSISKCGDRRVRTSGRGRHVSAGPAAAQQPGDHSRRCRSTMRKSAKCASGSPYSRSLVRDSCEMGNVARTTQPSHSRKDREGILSPKRKYVRAPHSQKGRCTPPVHGLAIGAAGVTATAFWRPATTFVYRREQDYGPARLKRLSRVGRRVRAAG